MYRIITLCGWVEIDGIPYSLIRSKNRLLARELCDVKDESDVRGVGSVVSLLLCGLRKATPCQQRTKVGPTVPG